MALLGREVQQILRNGPGKRRIPELWDGKASERIAHVLTTGLTSSSRGF
jgi:hypothetical protein